MHCHGHHQDPATTHSSIQMTCKTYAAITELSVPQSPFVWLASANVVVLHLNARKLLLGSLFIMIIKGKTGPCWALVRSGLIAKGKFEEPASCPAMGVSSGTGSDRGTGTSSGRGTRTGAGAGAGTGTCASTGTGTGTGTRTRTGMGKVRGTVTHTGAQVCFMVEFEFGSGSVRNTVLSI